MKKTVLTFTLLFALISGASFAQQNPKTRIHQVGINFSTLNSFGLHYKTGNEKTLLRLSFLSLNLGSSAEWGKPEDSLDYKTQNYGAGFRLGFEKRVQVVSQLNFIWGLEAGLNYTYNKQSAEYPNSNFTRTEWHMTPLVDVVIGLTYTIANHLVVGVEITPGIQYSFGKVKNITETQTSENTTSSFGFGFNNNAAALSVAYRFGK